MTRNPIRWFRETWAALDAEMKRAAKEKVRRDEQREVERIRREVRERMEAGE